MAIYHHCFDSPFSIAFVVSFVIAFISSANVIPGLLLTASMKVLTFTMTDREVFSKPQGRDCKELLKDWHSPTSNFFRD